MSDETGWIWLAKLWEHVEWSAYQAKDLVQRKPIREFYTKKTRNTSVRFFLVFNRLKEDCILRSVGSSPFSKVCVF